MAAPLLQLIKQGDPVALATLMNHSLQAHGIKVQVQRRHDCLHVLLDAEHLPTQQSAVAFVRSGLQLLEIEPIHTVRVYGRSVGDRLPVWQQTILLQPLIVPMAEAPSTPQLSADSSVTESLHQLTEAADALIKPEAIASSTDISASIPEILRRPEAIIFLTFCSVILLWETYLSILEEAAPDAALSSGQLAQRLKTSRRAVRRMRRLDSFSRWTRSLDPEGIAWMYQRGVYVPKQVGH